MNGIEHIRGQTYHGRRGGARNAFRYGVDYVLLEPEAEPTGPVLFSRARRNVFSISSRDHGGPVGAGRGVAWVRDLLAAPKYEKIDGRILLLAQPKVLGHVFNPVSFWLCHDRAGRLRLVIAEVTNTFGQRHSYLCHRDDLGPIDAEDRLHARKNFHVSPFQPVNGSYEFRFDIRSDRIGIWINFEDGSGKGGLMATLTGRREALTNRSILASCLRRPLGSRRVLGLIHWQALKLWLKGQIYRDCPPEPDTEVSR